MDIRQTIFKLLLINRFSPISTGRFNSITSLFATNLRGFKVWQLFIFPALAYRLVTSSLYVTYIVPGSTTVTATVVLYCCLLLLHTRDWCTLQGIVSDCITQPDRIEPIMADWLTDNCEHIGGPLPRAYYPLEPPKSHCPVIYRDVLYMQKYRRITVFCRCHTNKHAWCIGTDHHHIQSVQNKQTHNRYWYFKQPQYIEIHSPLHVTHVNNCFILVAPYIYCEIC